MFVFRMAAVAAAGGTDSIAVLIFPGRYLCANQQFVVDVVLVRVFITRLTMPPVKTVKQTKPRFSESA